MDMMEDQELVIHPTAHVFLDLRESNTLTQLTNVPLEQGVVADFFGNNDLDKEDVEEPLPERNRAAAPIYRDRLSPLEDQSDDEEERGEVDVEDDGAWRQGATTPEQLSFTGEHGVKKTPDDKSPFSFFWCMVDDDMMGSIVKETNDYAKESLKKNALSPNSRLRNYCSTLEFYTGKKPCSTHGATFDVVNRLIAPYSEEGRTLFVDNYYTSPDLFTYLKQHKTLACGTLRLNRKNGPPKAMLPKLKRADTTTSSLTNSTLTLLRFYNKREVNILTTAHDDSKVNTGKTNPVTHEPIIKLAAVADYNRFMGAVDRSDQMVSYNAFKRRTLKWWKKAFFHMFMLAVLNSYILHKCTVPAAQAISHRIFRRDPAMQMVAWAPLSIGRTLRDIGETVVLRLTAHHFPEPKERILYEIV
ncbi:PiggyBac transposable element-derived protein 4-like [Elysia marginata]|uniref:PiggyBac transposable element-derived protein 4-like n=1 Tax=Elysia marginata TaxID=1093978 RepID=A0AAV4I8S4_9GAST|nr:PiggyBac transposable element-derived protein 4-like [Elysia marginata]